MVTVVADVEMPQLGETVDEGTIIEWFKNEGDTVEEGEILFEVSTDKVDTEVPAPASGTLAEIFVRAGDTVAVGTVLARLTNGTDTESRTNAGNITSPPNVRASKPADAVLRPTVFEIDGEPHPSLARKIPHSATDRNSVSPRARRLADINEIDASQLQGAGDPPRVLYRDVVDHLDTRPEPPAKAPIEPTPAEPASVTTRTIGPRDQRIPHSRIRQVTAEHMVRSTNTTPHALTAIEVDYQNVDTVRLARREQFKEHHGTSLTYLPFIARAVIDALQQFPHLNASYGPDELIAHATVNLAIAVDLDFEGLVAPTVKNAESKRLTAIALEIASSATRARNKQLGADDLANGTFTITNAGSYGTMMQFPIINQPQVAILSTDGIKRRPVVADDGYGNECIVIHPVGVLAMAWDHRAIDGAYAAAFLAHVKSILETKDWHAEF